MSLSTTRKHCCDRISCADQHLANIFELPQNKYHVPSKLLASIDVIGYHATIHDPQVLMSSHRNNHAPINPSQALT